MADELPPPAPTPGTKEAIIFLPGLGGGQSAYGPDQTTDGVARRLANAIALAYGSATVSVEAREHSYGQEIGPYKSRVCTIKTANASACIPAIDVYGVDYGRTLTRDFSSRSLPVKCLLAFGQIVGGFWLIVTTFFRRGRSATSAAQKLQLLWASFILLLLCIYLALMVITAVGIVAAWFPGVKTAAPPAVVQAEDSAGASTRPTTTSRSPDSNRLSRAAQALAWVKRRQDGLAKALLLLTALGIVLPKNPKQAVSDAALDYLCAIYYVRYAGRAAELRAQLAFLLKSISQAQGNAYGRIHLLGFSFGSLLAMDVLFRPESPPEPVFGNVDCLVTIGCPYDLIRTFWPDHFRRRCQIKTSAPRKWVNVYAPLDVLGSNFRNDDMPGKAVQGVEVTDPGAASPIERMPDVNARYLEGPTAQSASVLSYLALVGLQAHGRYWSRGEELATDCFELVVQAMYRDN